MAFNGAFFLPLFWKSGVPWVGGVVGETTNIADSMILIDRQMSYDDLVEEVSKKCKVDPRVTQMSFTLVWSDGLDRRSYVFIDDKRFVCAIYMYAYCRLELYVSLEHNVFQSSEPVLPMYEFGGSSQPVRDEHNIRDPVSLDLNINHLDLNEYPVDLNETDEDSDDPTYMEDLDEIDIDEDSACSESSLEPSGSDSDDEAINHVPIDHYVYGVVGDEPDYDVGTGLSGRWDGNVDTITAGTVFKSKLEVQNALTVWSAKRGVSYCSVESNKKTWSVKCVTSKYPVESLLGVNCGWSMRASKQAGTGKWKIVKWAPQHNCAGATNASRRKKITSREIASLVMSKIKLDTGKKVGRKVELAKPEEIIEHVNNRTVAVSLAYDVKLEDVESFFTKFGKVNSVRLPKHVSNKNAFCGTALVEFSTEEDAEKLLKLTLAYDGADLEFKPKKDFDAEREKQADESDKTQLLGKRKGSEEANYPKGLIIAFKLNSKSSGGDSKQNGAQEHVSEVEAPKTEGDSVVDASEGASMASENVEKGPEDNKEITDNASNSNEEVKEGEVDEKSTDTVDKNEGEKAVEGQSTRESYKYNMDVVIREDLKAVFEKFGKVKFIDFNMGEESGYIRFEEPEGSQKARAAAVLNEEGGLLVKNYIATLEPVSGEAEKKYWSQIQENQKAHYKGHHRGGRGGRFNRGGGRHGRSRDNHSPAGRHNKAQRV